MFPSASPQIRAPYLGLTHRLFGQTNFPLSCLCSDKNEVICRKHPKEEYVGYFPKHLATGSLGQKKMFVKIRDSSLP